MPPALYTRIRQLQQKKFFICGGRASEINQRARIQLLHTPPIFSPGDPPADPDALHAQAIAALRAGRVSEAVALLRQVTAQRPNSPDAHNDLGAALDGRMEFPEAIEHYQHAVRLRPGFFQARCNLASALMKIGELGEAESHCRHVLDEAPRYADAHNLAGALRLERRDPAGAIECLDRAIALDPNHIESHANRGVALLTLGDLPAGWAECEWRRKRPGWSRSGRPWTGQDPFGQTLLLWAEGGMGNAIQYLRYAALLVERGGQVILECDALLHPLLQRAPGIWKLSARGGPMPHHNYWCPLASLPAILETDLETIPRDVPYLHPDAKLLESWKPRIAAIPGFRIGVIWEAEQRTSYGRQRSAPLECLAELAGIPGVTLVSLQRGWNGEASFPILRFDGLDETNGPFTDTAAIMRCLDLVITIDTSTAHLGGALGVPVWVALRHAPDYRWMLDRDDSPWYPTLRLFRQPERNDWPGVYRAIARALRERT